MAALNALTLGRTVPQSTSFSAVHHRDRDARNPIAPAPGQFVTIRSTACLDPLLRRPFAVSSFDLCQRIAAFVYERRGKATNIITAMAAGDSLDVLGPLGNQFPNVEPGNIPSLLIAFVNAIRRLLERQTPNIDVTTARAIINKTENYTSLCFNISGGSYIIPSIVSTLSAIVDFAYLQGEEKSFFPYIQRILSLISYLFK